MIMKMKMKFCQKEADSLAETSDDTNHHEGKLLYKYLYNTCIFILLKLMKKKL